MTKVHDRLECSSCHAAWTVDFFGFHFDRNEQFTQLDLLSGRRTPGRVTTQEKVFATFNPLRLGFNHEGKVAPYVVGFSTIGSFHDDQGALGLDQALPVTAAGQSGVTKSVPAGIKVSGYPAAEHESALKIQALTRRLPELFQMVRDLRAKVDELERELEKARERVL